MTTVPSSMTIASEENIQSPVLIVLVGPTGVGKTALSLTIARVFNAPIVSSDSRQFFREMSIGTAAPTAQELSKAKHYFVGTHSIHEEYSAGQFELDALNLFEELFQKGKVVVLSGGSMLYLDAVCKGMDDIPPVKPEVRMYWQEEFAKYGLQHIQEALLKEDPVYYEEVDLMNHKRILHALEVCTSSGKPFSHFRTGISKERPFRILKIGLNRPRPELYERINRRVDMMMDDGLLQEAKGLYQFRHLNALNTVGYKEIFGYLDGEYDLEKAVELIKRNSRHYAKRQLTWFNRNSSINWFHPDQVEDVINFVRSKIFD